MNGYRLEVDLPGLTPLNSAANMTWRRKVSTRKKLKRIMWALIPKAKRPPGGPVAHARVTITRCSSVPADGDNLDHCAKWILDELVTLAVLPEDRATAIGKARVEWQREKPKRGHMLVVVEECGADEIDKSNWRGL